MVYCSLFLALCWGLWVQPLRASDTEAEQLALLFSQALEAQERNERAQALALYDSLNRLGYSSSEVLANQGLIYAQQQDWGKAVLYLERALVKDPANAVALHQLKTSVQRLEQAIEHEPEPLALTLVKGLRSLFSANTWAYLFALSLGLGLAFRLGPLFRWNLPSYLPHLAWPTWAWALLFCLPMGLWQQAAEFAQNKAVVMVAKVGLRSEPSYNGEEIFVVHAGNIAWIEAENESWVQVKLGNGYLGWLPSQSIERI